MLSKLFKREVEKNEVEKNELGATANKSNTVLDNVSKKRKGIIGLNMSPAGMFAGALIGTVVVSAMMILWSGQQEESKISMAADELVEIHNTALLYSTKATDTASGFSGMYATTMSPWLRTNLVLDDTTDTDVGAYFCSATPYGCKIKYYISTDTDTSTYGIYVDASTAFTDADLIKQYEITTEKAMKRVRPNLILDGDAAAPTAAGAAGGAVANDDDGQFAIHGLY